MVTRFLKKKRSTLLAGPDGRRSGKAKSNWKEAVKTCRKVQMLSKRQFFKNAIEGKLRVQSRASERLQDHIIEETKEMEHTKTEAVQLVRKEHDLWMYPKSPGKRGRIRKWLGRHQETYHNGQTGER